MTKKKVLEMLQEICELDWVNENDQLYNTLNEAMALIEPGNENE